ncbi:hypothetical protein Godav_027162 [Gossypium davidsonii]|uniref:RNase H type-1 domain-containing protein n=2 Tax=Gossypium TaxID=3633 RepID=A0A7J8RVY6_GOSDV|nr:hypothetical protein [Gossypium davidsonii]MBA0653085.1 hypothetical protein [Gossypium klotzschianum]
MGAVMEFGSASEGKGIYVRSAALGQCCRILTIAWCLWFHRNLIVWKQTDVFAAEIVAKADRFLTEWKDARAVFTRVQRFSMSFVNSRVDWEKLVVDLFKCNVGAASSLRLGCSSFSAIIWDHNSTINTMWEVRMAELLAIREALSWMNTLNVANVVLES